MNDHNTIDGNDHRLSDDEVDALARRSGAELRRPAPPGLVGGLRTARRRQQVTRLGGAGAAALVLVVGAFVVTRRGDDGGDIAPAAPVSTTANTSSGVDPTTIPAPAPTDPLPDSGTTTPSVPVSPSSTPPTSSIPLEPGAPTILGFRNDGSGLADVIDPTTLAVIDTVTAPEPATNDGGVTTSNAISASGAVTYHLPSPEAARDDCGQTPVELWVDGADPVGLPTMIDDLVVSDDRRTGLVVGSECGGDPGVWIFDANRPDQPARQLFSVDAEQEAVMRIQVNAVGSLAVVDTEPLPLSDGNGGTSQVIDTATGQVVAVLGSEGSSPDLPYTDCGWGWDGVSPVGATAINYAAYNCADDGFVIVVHDLVTGESVTHALPNYVGQTWETMVHSSIVFDDATYTDPASAWFVAKLDPDINGVENIYLFHGDERVGRIEDGYSWVAFDT